MKNNTILISAILIALIVASTPHISLANSSSLPTSKINKAVTPTQIPQKPVQGVTNSFQSSQSAQVNKPSPTKGVTPTQKPTVKRVKKPSPTPKQVHIDGQLAAFEVSSKSGTTLIIKKKNQIVKVKVLSSTQFKKHYWESTSLKETVVGDKVNVTGTFIDEKKTIMEAKLIRNLSILARRGVVFGTITTIGSTISIQPKDISIQKVTISSTTKLIGQDEKPLARKDLKVGDRVRVKGLFDRGSNTITEVTEIKDFMQSQGRTSGAGKK